MTSFPSSVLHSSQKKILRSVDLSRANISMEDSNEISISSSTFSATSSTGDIGDDPNNDDIGDGQSSIVPTCNLCNVHFLDNLSQLTHFDEKHEYDVDYIACRFCNLVFAPFHSKTLENHDKEFHTILVVNEEEEKEPEEEATEEDPFANLDDINLQPFEPESLDESNKSNDPKKNVAAADGNSAVNNQETDDDSYPLMELQDKMKLIPEIILQVSDNEIVLNSPPEKKEKDNSDYSKKCIICHSIFQSQRSYNDHIRQVHPNRYLPCNKCGKVLTSYAGRISHNKNNCGRNKKWVKKLTQCPFCKLLFDSGSKNYNNHLKEVHSDVTIKCPFCELIFTHENQIKDHLSTKHANNNGNNLGIIFQNKNSPERNEMLDLDKNYETGSKEVRSNVMIKCQFCELIFTTEEQIKYHLSTKHVNNNGNEAGMIFQNNCELDSGKNNENRPKEVCSDVAIKCQFCELVFRNEKLLAIHRSRSHGNDVHCPKCDKSNCCHICPHCGKYFSYNSNRNAHIRVKHKDKCLKCPLCETSLINEIAIKIHYHRIHRGKTPRSTEPMEVDRENFNDGENEDENRNPNVPFANFTVHQRRMSVQNPMTALTKHVENTLDDMENRNRKMTTMDQINLLANTVDVNEGNYNDRPPTPPLNPSNASPPPPSDEKIMSSTSHESNLRSNHTQFVQFINSLNII